MSDHDGKPDPIDQAYAEAQAVLADEAARAARRARVLGAVAKAPAAPAADAPPVTQPRGWGQGAWGPGGRARGGWLVAAGVAGVALFVAFRIMPPVWLQPQSAPEAAAPSAPQPAPPLAARSTPLAEGAPPPQAAAQGAAPGGPSAASGTLAADKSAASPAGPSAAPPAEAAAAPPVLSEPRPFPGAPPSAPRPSAARASPPPAPPPPPSARPSPPPPPAMGAGAEDKSDVGEVVVTGQRREERLQDSPVAVTGFSGNMSGADADLDPAARLRAAAAAGRTGKVKALLADGVPVDAEDDDGNTALMLSIQANRPATARLLRRHGASLDHRNHAGESARDMAAKVGDERLDEALGVKR